MFSYRLKYVLKFAFCESDQLNRTLVYCQQERATKSQDDSRFLIYLTSNVHLNTDMTITSVKPDIVVRA